MRNVAEGGAEVKTTLRKSWLGAVQFPLVERTGHSLWGTVSAVPKIGPNGSRLISTESAVDRGGANLDLVDLCAGNRVARRSYLLSG